MLFKKMHTLKFLLLLVVTTTSLAADASLLSWLTKKLSFNAVHSSQDEPYFTDILRVLEAQPIEGSKLVYWDQDLADLLKIKNPPGRVGQESFDRWVLQQLAFEIQENAIPIDPQDHQVRDSKKNLLWIEADAHRGAGRAGYLKIGNSWVNIKGIGRTGLGTTNGHEIGPPYKTFRDHQDGSITLEEAIKEAINARIAHNELSRGSSRVLAIVFTGRTLTYPDGTTAQLALIIRAPLKRFDRQLRAGQTAKNQAKDLIAESLAQANAKRLMKGDFVNASNMGANGEFIDFGCSSHTCGFNRVYSSEHTGPFNEDYHNLINNEIYKEKIGFYLLNQLGLPESDIQNASLSAFNFQRIHRRLLRVLHLSAEEKLLDFKAVDPEYLVGRYKLHVFFQDLAANFFASRMAEADFVLQETQRLETLAGHNLNDYEKGYVADFLKSLHFAFSEIYKKSPSASQPHYAPAVRKMAHFKNRDITGIVRPQLFSSSGEVAKAFMANKDGTLIDRFIHETVANHKLGTNPVGDSYVQIKTNARATEVFVRAHIHPQGGESLFAYPEIQLQGDERMMFRLSTDNWKSYKDVSSKTVETQYGTYFQIEIPHGWMPVTGDRLEMSPFKISSSGEKVFLLDNFVNLKGPVLMLNEREGLAADFKKVRDYMRSNQELPISQMLKDLDVKKILKLNFLRCEQIFNY